MTIEKVIKYLEAERTKAIDRKDEWSNSTRDGAVGVEMFYLGKIEGLERALDLLKQMEG